MKRTAKTTLTGLGGAGLLGYAGYFLSELSSGAAPTSAINVAQAGALTIAGLGGLSWAAASWWAKRIALVTLWATCESDPEKLAKINELTILLKEPQPS